ncbi:MAG: hypothetical protein ACOCRK_08290, partial [bacterium]
HIIHYLKERLNNNRIPFTIGILGGIPTWYFIFNNQLISAIISFILLSLTFELYSKYIYEEERLIVTQLNNEPNEDFLKRLILTIEESNK